MGCCLLVAMILSGWVALRKTCRFLRSKNNAQEWRLIKYKEDSYE